MEVTEARTEFSGCGFGFLDDSGEMTHHFWFRGCGTENGPYRIPWMAYQNYDQFKEILSFLKSLQDQIFLIKMTEPANINLQDFIGKPNYYSAITKNTDFENNIKLVTDWQLRINDLQECISKISIDNNLEFNLRLNDPIYSYLKDMDDIKWKGIGGDYIVSLNNSSSVKSGFDSNLETLEASVGAFSRMWIGSDSATSLSISDEFKCSDNLLEKLDNCFRLPTPVVDWLF